MTPNSSRSRFLNRYTSLPSLIDSLVNKRLTLLSPKSWEDKNDIYYMERYKAVSGNKTVLALCFSTRRETFHHWKIFSGGSAGVCIEFDRDMMLGSLKYLSIDRGARFRTGRVSYRPITEVEGRTPPLKRWPFVKRLPFRDEGEVRIVYQNRKVSEKTKDIPLDLDWIIKVTLSPWMPEEIAKSVAKVVRSIKGCKKLNVSQSHLLDTARWRKVIEGPLPRAD